MKRYNITFIVFFLWRIGSIPPSMGRRRSGLAVSGPPVGSEPLADFLDFSTSNLFRMFRALGDPFRLRLLARLAGCEVCVSELAELEDEKLTTVSARLNTLLVKQRREARHIFYGVSDAHVLQLVQSAMKHPAERQRHLDRSRRRRRIS